MSAQSHRQKKLNLRVTPDQAIIIDRILGGQQGLLSSTLHDGDDPLSRQAALSDMDEHNQLVLIREEIDRVCRGVVYGW